jgi:hypothetical protein
MNTETSKIIKIKVKKIRPKVVLEDEPLNSNIILFNTVLKELMHGDKTQMILDLFNKRKMIIQENNLYSHSGKIIKKECVIMNGKDAMTSKFAKKDGSIRTFGWSTVWGVLHAEWFNDVAVSYNSKILYEIIKTKTLIRIVQHEPLQKCGIEVLGMVRILSKDGEKYCITGRTKPTRFNISCEQTDNRPTWNSVKSLQQACRDNKIRGFIHWDKQQLVEHLMKV